MVYIGIDNGLSGGLVALSDVAGVAPIAMIPMPLEAKKKGEQVAILGVWAWISQFKNHVFLLIEKPNNAGGKITPSTAASMADSFAVLRAMCALKGLRWSPVTPQSWQKEMIPGCEKGQTKQYALSIARNLWPDEKWLATPRCTTPHNGMVDAALIAEFARRKGL